MAFPWRLAHLLLSRDCFKTRPLKLNSTIFLLPTKAGFMSSIIFFFLLFRDYSTNDYNIYNEYIEGKVKHFYAVKMQNGKKQEVQQLSKAKQTITVTAFLLERLAPLFYLAHFPVFFLGETQMPQQKQKWDQRPQCVFENWQNDLKL